MNYLEIGIVGVVVMSVLSAVTLWRLALYVKRSDYISLVTSTDYDSQSLHAASQTKSFRKQFLFHIFLLLASVCDIPMYVSFIMYHNYGVITYGFHKLESAFLLLAFSITISDWSKVLFDIREENMLPFAFRKVSLVAINVVSIVISLVDFISIIVYDDNDAFARTTVYLIGFIIQILAPLLLNVMMLHAGLKLSQRIRGCAGTEHMITVRQDLLSSPSKGNKPLHSPTGSHRFMSALKRLILVMATCSFCIFLQVTFLCLSYIMGSIHQADSSVGPSMLYWVCVAWLPLWGTVLSLLYLSKGKKKLSPSIANQAAVVTPSTESAEPLINGRPYLGGRPEGHQHQQEYDKRYKSSGGGVTRSKSSPSMPVGDVSYGQSRSLPTRKSNLLGSPLTHSHTPIYSPLSGAGSTVYEGTGVADMCQSPEPYSYHPQRYLHDTTTPFVANGQQHSHAGGFSVDEFDEDDEMSNDYRHIAGGSEYNDDNFMSRNQSYNGMGYNNDISCKGASTVGGQEGDILSLFSRYMLAPPPRSPHQRAHKGVERGGEEVADEREIRHSSSGASTSTNSVLDNSGSFTYRDTSDQQRIILEAAALVNTGLLEESRDSVTTGQTSTDQRYYSEENGLSSNSYFISQSSLSSGSLTGSNPDGRAAVLQSLQSPKHDNDGRSLSHDSNLNLNPNLSRNPATVSHINRNVG